MKSYSIYGKIRGVSCILFFIFLFLLIGCATVVNIEKAKEDLEVHLNKCTSAYGYDPDTVEGIGPYQLAKGEREWRSCVYKGIESIIIPSTLIPDVYLNLIAEDKKMTDAIEKGEMTRSQRKERLQRSVEEIKLLEDEARARQFIELNRKMRDLEFQRQQMEIRDNISRSRQEQLLNTMTR